MGRVAFFSLGRFGQMVSLHLQKKVPQLLFPWDFEKAFSFFKRVICIFRSSHSNCLCAEPDSQYVVFQRNKSFGNKKPSWNLFNQEEKETNAILIGRKMQKNDDAKQCNNAQWD